MGKSERDFHAGESGAKFVHASFQKQLVNLGALLSTHKAWFCRSPERVQVSKE